MLTANNISYSIKNKRILKDVSFNAPQGQLLSIIGPNGAGKSTLLKILSSELQKYSGEVILNEKNITAQKAKDLALKRAVLSQSISLTLPFKVLEVVMMGRYPHFDSRPSAKDDCIVKESLVLTGMENFIDRNFLTLSGGEKQRVHLARVLAQLNSSKNSSATESKTLLLDEPINGLDLKYQQQVMQIVSEWKGANNTVIAVLHDLNLAAHYSDKILLLNNGEKELLDTPENVLTKENIKKVYDVEIKVVRETPAEKMYISPVYSDPLMENRFSILV